MSGVPNPTCAQAGVVNVLISLDESIPVSVGCAAGFGTIPGVQTMSVAPGAHSLTITAVNSTGYAYYRFTGSLTTAAGTPQSVAHQLPWAVGGTAVRWTLSDSGNPVSCATAGIGNVSINFFDGENVAVYGNAGDSKPCSSAGVTYPYLRPGTYAVSISAQGASNSIYVSDDTAPVMVNVVAGQFVDVAGAVTVPVARIQ
jgi:hypothetical protein